MLEYILRWLLVLPFIFITYQVIMLNKKFLHSLAWKFIGGAFVLFAVRAVVAALGLFTIPVTVNIIIALIGYILLMVGFHRLRNDFLKITKIKFDN